MTEPRLIKFDKIGSEEDGFISVANYKKEVPFPINRVYWTYNTNDKINRGNHSHKCLQQVIVAVYGEIRIKFLDKKLKEYVFTLNDPSIGVVVPPGFWRELEFTNNAVLLCLASHEYDELDYIRDFNSFKNG